MIGTTLNQRFTLDEKLGQGGMGAVFRATDQILQRPVAIKVLKDLTGEEVGKRICLEARILARLVHENIVRLYDFSLDNGTYYFIMEVVDGPSFHKRWRKITLEERLEIVAQVADALDYAHHQGVIHKDVKPANILLTAADQAKLSDFGLSVLMDDAQESGVVRGTPHYMSPEQAKGRRLDHRTDLYALGVILYESVAGTPPFVGPAMSVMSQHATVEPVSPREKNPGITPELQELILALMAKRPEARPGSGREVADRIRDLVAQHKVQAAGSSSSAPGAALEPPGVGVSREGPSAPVVSGEGTRGARPEDKSAALLPAPAPIAKVPPPPPPRPKKSASPLVEAVVEAVTAEPIELGGDDRYLCGHYLAYLLGGSRRRGFLLRRPLDPLNADRARLLLGMTALTLPGDANVTMGQVASLLDERPDVRTSLSPIVVMKYLAARGSAGKRRKFRQIRQQLQQASEYAARHLTDDQGVLNPGLMPQKLADLQRLAPARTEIDEHLVQRWNEVTEVWRGIPEFRESVLRYATSGAWRDPASIDLWPEVVYPLIERARRQRQLRSGTEAFWDAICARLLFMPDAGVRMDRAIVKSVPEPIVEKLDISINAFEDEPEIGEAAQDPKDPESEGLSITMAVSEASFHDLDAGAPTRTFVKLPNTDPFRQTLGGLRELWQEAITALRNPGEKQGHRHVPIGPYRLTVVPTIRARNAGQVAIQGMPNKQLEMLVPSFTGGGSNSKVVLAVWVYPNNSVVLTYFDHMNNQKYICWDAGTSQQSNFDDASALNHLLYTLGMEVPDQLDQALSKSFRPRNPV